MCDSCYDPDGGTCGCEPCLVNQGSNWCTVCAHHGWEPGVPAATDDASGSGWDDTSAGGGDEAWPQTE